MSDQRKEESSSEDRPPSSRRAASAEIGARADPATSAVTPRRLGLKKSDDREDRESVGRDVGDTRAFPVSLADAKLPPGAVDLRRRRKEGTTTARTDEEEAKVEVATIQEIRRRVNATGTTDGATATGNEEGSRLSSHVVGLGASNVDRVLPDPPLPPPPSSEASSRPGAYNVPGIGDQTHDDDGEATTAMQYNSEYADDTTPVVATATLVESTRGGGTSELVFLAERLESSSNSRKNFNSLVRDWRFLSLLGLFIVILIIALISILGAQGVFSGTSSSAAELFPSPTPTMSMAPTWSPTVSMAPSLSSYSSVTRAIAQDFFLNSQRILSETEKEGFQAVMEQLTEDSVAVEQYTEQYSDHYLSGRIANGLNITCSIRSQSLMAQSVSNPVQLGRTQFWGLEIQYDMTWRSRYANVHRLPDSFLEFMKDRSKIIANDMRSVGGVDIFGGANQAFGYEQFPTLAPGVEFEPPKPTLPPASCEPTVSAAPTSASFNNYLETVVPISSEALLRGCSYSPQRRALEFVVGEDGKWVDPAIDPEKFRQRFALATLFYSTGGDTEQDEEDGSWGTWTGRYGFLTDTDECDWKATDNQGTLIKGVTRCDGNGRVTNIQLAGSGLAGTLPPEIQSLASLELLHVAQNGIGGTIPPELVRLASLTDIRAFENRFVGRLPSNFGNLNKLTYLAMQNNNIEGPMPPNIGNATGLTDLLLQNNDMTGRLPSSMGGLVVLQELFLEDNQFTGTIPAEMGSMRSLRNIWLSQNAFTGGMDVFCDPESGISPSLFYADCLGTSFPETPPQVDCSCCTICCNEDGDCLPNN